MMAHRKICLRSRASAAFSLHSHGCALFWALSPSAPPDWQKSSPLDSPITGLRALDKWLCMSSAHLLPTADSDERRQITRGHHGQATCSSRDLVARCLRSAAKDQDVRRVECEMSTGILGAFRGHAPVRLRTDRNSFLGSTDSRARKPFGTTAAPL